MGDYNLPPDLARAIAALSNRVSALERTRTIPVGSGAPTGALADGALYGDKVGSFFYVVLNGVPKKVAVA